MSTTGRDRWVARGLGASVLAQGVGLVLLGRLEGAALWQVLVVSSALAMVTVTAWRHRLLLNHRIDMLLVMAAGGGLGMLVGWWVDLGYVAPAAGPSFHLAMGHAACHGPQSAGSWQMVFSWMTALMLLGAIPPGVLLTRCAELARSGWRRWASTHIVGNVVMVAGMVWLGHWLGPGLARLAGSGVVGGHLAMLIGMLAGMEAGMFAGEAVLGLKPWQEWRWREQA